MSKKIEAIFLDVGGVVLQIDWFVTMAGFGFNSPRAQGEALQKLFDWLPFSEFERGQVSESEFFAGVNKLYGISLPQTQLQKAWNDLILGELKGIHDIFDEYESKVPIYALSNTNVTHMNYMMTRYPALKRFKKFFASNEVGERKPGRQIYEKVLAQTGVKPAGALFIDDTQVNVDTAQALGIHAFQTINSPQESLKKIRSLF